MEKNTPVPGLVGRSAAQPVSRGGLEEAANYLFSDEASGWQVHGGIAFEGTLALSIVQAMESGLPA